MTVQGLASSARWTLAMFAATALFACTPAMNPPPDVTPPPPGSPDIAIAAEYPTVSELYGGAQGIYRGCGPNGNVCHNARQFPNMNTLGALTENIGLPCNTLQSDPTRIDEWCERQGDWVVFDTAMYRLGYIAMTTPATATQGAQWTIEIQAPFPPLTATSYFSVVRYDPNQTVNTLIGFSGANVMPDPGSTSRVIVQESLTDTYRAQILARAGVPGDPAAIQFGDANRNGSFGYYLGNALILPGHPERSYIIKRLTDPTGGPLMPLANCCFWSKDSLRALWCWIAGLQPDGSNALDPINYGTCPAGPVENVLYPDPGPMCNPAGSCPVRVRGPIPTDPTWANIYANVLTNRCAGGGCHFDGASGGLDMRTADVAYADLVHSTPPRVMPGNAMSSLLYLRLTQTCTVGHACTRMPFGGAPLPDNELSLISQWIQAGAPQNGSFDAGVPDAGGPDTGAPDTGTPSDGSSIDATTSDVPAGMDSGVPVDAALDTGAAGDTGTTPTDAGTQDAGGTDAGGTG